MFDVVSRAEYARMKGVAQSTVKKWIDRGHIRLAVVMKANRQLINVEVADKELEQNLDYSRSMGKKAANQAAKNQTVTSESPEKKAKKVEKQSEFKSLADARIEKEHFDTLLKKQKYEKERGNLLDKDKVKAHILKLTTTTKEALFNIPDAYGPELLACDDLIELQNLLKKALNEALEKLNSNGKI